MAEFVGLSRNLKLSQMNFAAELSKENLPEAEFKARLNEYLSAEIKSPTNLRKTREILARIWFYESGDFVEKIRDDARNLLEKFPSSRRGGNSLVHVADNLSDFCGHRGNNRATCRNQRSFHARQAERKII